MIQRLANPLGHRQLEQMFGVSQGSVAHFTKRFIEAISGHPPTLSNPHTLWMYNKGSEVFLLLRHCNEYEIS